MKRKCYKNVGLYITWLEEHDRVRYIEYPRDWCAGAKLYVFIMSRGNENVYMLGFDLSEHDEPINNIYKGTDNYLSEESKGFNTDNWTTQLIQTFKDFPDTQFHWVVDSDNQVLWYVKMCKVLHIKNLTKFVVPSIINNYVNSYVKYIKINIR